MLARAQEYQGLLGQPGIATRADLARHFGVSRARVTQALAVLDVPGPLMDTLRAAEARGRPVTEGVWRKIRGLPESEVLGRLREWGYS